MKLLWKIRTILRELMILKPLIWIFLLCFHLLNSLHKDWIVVYTPCSYHLMGLFLFSNIHFRGTITLQIGIRLQWAMVLILQSNPKRSIGCRSFQQWYEIQHYQLKGCWEARPSATSPLCAGLTAPFQHWMQKMFSHPNAVKYYGCHIEGNLQ